MNPLSKSHTDGMTIIWISMLSLLTLLYILVDMDFFYLAMIFGIGFIIIYRQHNAAVRKNMEDAR